MVLKRLAVAACAVGLFFTQEACKKKVVAAAPTPPPQVTATPPPPPPARPAVSRFTVEPSTIERGQSATIRWAVENATEVSITPNLGNVGLSGTRQVYPGSDIEYVLTARGPGGEATASARVRVTVPTPPAPTVSKAPDMTFGQRIAQYVSDIYFAYDSSEISSESQAVLNKNAGALKEAFAAHASGSVTIEGHCDERGSAEYNIGLGDRRATATKDFLTNLGVDGNRLRVVSYGKEKPQCTDASEDCYQKNRRSHFVAVE